MPSLSWDFYKKDKHKHGFSPDDCHYHASHRLTAPLSLDPVLPAFPRSRDPVQSPLQRTHRQEKHKQPLPHLQMEGLWNNLCKTGSYHKPSSRFVTVVVILLAPPTNTPFFLFYSSPYTAQTPYLRGQFILLFTHSNIQLQTQLRYARNLSSVPRTSKSTKRFTQKSTMRSTSTQRPSP